MPNEVNSSAKVRLFGTEEIDNKHVSNKRSDITYMKFNKEDFFIYTCLRGMSEL